MNCNEPMLRVIPSTVMLELIARSRPVKTPSLIDRPGDPKVALANSTEPLLTETFPEVIWKLSLAPSY